MKFKSTSIKVIYLALTIFNISPSLNGADESPQEDQWSCSGWCFMGGDTPTNPWIPVSSSGSTEQEARDNIDCGMYEEAGISCRKVQ